MAKTIYGEHIAARMTDPDGTVWRFVIDIDGCVELQGKRQGWPWATARRIPIHSETWPDDVDYSAKLADVAGAARRLGVSSRAIGSMKRPRRPAEPGTLIEEHW